MQDLPQKIMHRMTGWLVGWLVGWLAGWLECLTYQIHEEARDTAQPVMWICRPAQRMKTPHRSPSHPRGYVWCLQLLPSSQQYESLKTRKRKCD